MSDEQFNLEDFMTQNILENKPQISRRSVSGRGRVDDRVRVDCPQPMVTTVTRTAILEASHLASNYASCMITFDAYGGFMVVSIGKGAEHTYLAPNRIVLTGANQQPLDILRYTIAMILFNMPGYVLEQN